METLGDLGERAIIEDLLKPRYQSNGASFGDDCAAVPVLSGDLYQIATTDPCPIPAASLLGFDDFYYWGWLLATINMSDLAAAGARPVGLLSSLILPSDFRIADFLRMLDGLDECLLSADALVLGGNLKEGKDVALSATALGCSDGLPLTRRGAQIGDLVVVLGDLGSFWAGYLAESRNVNVSPALRESLMRNVLTPSAKVALGQELRKLGLVNSCLDNSDGLYPSMLALSASSGVQVFLTVDDWEMSDGVPEVASQLGVRPQRLGLGWGDWQLLVTVSPERLGQLTVLTREAGHSAFVVGEVRSGSGVRAAYEGAEGYLMQLDSQRFAPDSWFGTGIESYIESLLHSPLVIAASGEEPLSPLG